MNGFTSNRYLSTGFLSRIRRRHALWLLGGAAGALMLPSCQPRTSRQSSAPAKALSLGTAPWVGQVPLYIAQEKGFFTAEGLDLDLKIFSSGGDYMSAFVGGNLDGVSPVSSEALIMRSQGKDFKIVLIQDNSVGGDGILARDTISSIADFKGKEVAVDTSAVSYFFLLQVLKEAGLSKEDIKVINADAPSAAAAFEAGNVDIAVTYAPYLPETDRAVENGRIIYDSSKMPTAIIDLYMFDTAFIESNPEAVQAFVNGVLKGTDFLQTNPDEALAIGAAELEVTPEELAGDLKGVKIPDQQTNLKMLADPNSDLYLAKPLAQMAAFLQAEGQIKGDIGDPAALFDPQFVRAYQAS